VSAVLSGAAERLRPMTVDDLARVMEIEPRAYEFWSVIAAGVASATTNWWATA